MLSNVQVVFVMPRFVLQYVLLWCCRMHHRNATFKSHDDVIKWKHFPHNWPFVREIHRSPVNSPHKGQWRGALMFSLICVWINDWVNNREAGDLRRNRAHYDVTVMKPNQITMLLFVLKADARLSKTCLGAFSFVPFCTGKMHERFSASAVFPVPNRTN